ncbi:MAG: Hcp family type VI secretion system effector [Planctomycetota bacterium]
MAYDGFLQIDGIPGESTDEAHADWIEIISFRHDVSQPAGTATSRVGGRTGARVNVADFTITKVIDKSTPNLNLYCCNGQHIPKVTIELCEAGGDKHMYMQWILEDVIISSVKPSGVANEEVYTRPIEEVSFNFGLIRWAYTPMDHTGKPGAAMQAGWSMELNKPM